ncbi:unnamed protein product [Hydatigera taeniaeformis]|uniref:Sulfate_transp domain-containing protein n=1 Tax=Hydatigena taeniaeformis TaxID=6205 RepID=A0A0R3XC41_HYDTA|nr:unnamed protein product [Hydatigera taeniaeformis]
MNGFEVDRLPAPVVPTFSYFSDLVPDIFVIAIITFAINAGLVKTYAAEFGYDVLDNQIASLISSGIFVIILFFIAPYLESLPRAVLGCIVCVALTSTFKKVLDLRRLWKVSKTDAVGLVLCPFATSLFLIHIALNLV